MSSPTVHIVDDDESFLRAVTRLLRASGLEVKTFMSGADFLSQPLHTARGCVISDLQMPGMNGLAFQEAMIQAGHSMPVIFLTGNGDIPSTVSAMKQGAVDFLEKRAPKEQLLEAVSRAFARDEAERVQRTLQREVKNRFASLSDREKEVLAEVVRGKMNKEIASDLGIHERTVKLHRTAITTKLQVQSVAELTRLWLILQGKSQAS
ncbi:MAG: response regulator transcription factor [Verrucomicrobiaceae bacterium]|nr:response regulator transcription factor [Verrucomicrobiaceae bacterium]